LLEAFACGIPTVSTRIGAEGLAHNDGEFCRLADDPLEFARRVIELLHDPSSATDMARRARREVEQNWDMRKAARKLEARYRALLEAKRSPATGA
jgi:glycosyltransferase involved in cell wall biosynthesis